MKYRKQVEWSVGVIQRSYIQFKVNLNEEFIFYNNNIKKHLLFKIVILEATIFTYINITFYTGCNESFVRRMAIGAPIFS